MKNRNRLLQALCLLLLRRRHRKRTLRKRALCRTRRWHVRPTWLLRARCGQFANVLKCLKEEDRENYYRYMRMSPERFNEVLALVKPFIRTRCKRRRDQITVEERLAVTLRYLATGNSQSTESFSFLLGRSTVCEIISEVCEAIWKGLQPKYLQTPSNEDQYKKIADNFERLWNFPHCLGAIDGKHVQIECPQFGGSDFFNRKGYHSTIFMAICDANYSFTHTSFGSYGRECDATIFSHTQIFGRMEDGSECVPQTSPMCDGQGLPYVFVGDDIFPLKPWLMKPFPGRSESVQEKIFNFRLSRARRVIENAFGLLAARWRIFRRPIKASIQVVDKICQAAVCLHNFLLLTDNARYMPQGFVDSFTVGGDIVSGDWRNITTKDEHPFFQPLPRQGTNHALTAKQIRHNFCDYVNGPGALEWQEKYVTYDGKRGPVN